MKMRLKKQRVAIAMIELIFAIVVMGIAMLGIPMVTSQTLKGTESMLMQESISEAAANVGMIMVLPWDGAYVNGTTPTPSNVVLQTASTKFDNRQGLVALYNARVAPTGVLATNSATSNLNNISDYNGKEIKVAVATTGQETEVYEGDYADKTVTMTSKVAFAPDTVTLGATTTFNFNPDSTNAGSTSIKSISTTLKGTEEGFEKGIVLNAFSCNIGTASARTAGE